MAATPKHEPEPTDRYPALEPLEALFSPRAVAVIGAAREENKVGHVVFDNLLRDFKSPVLPVNPKADEIHGRPCYPSLKDLPQPVDLVVVAVPNRLVPGVIAESAEAGARAAIVISAGFRESGIEGAKLEAELLKAARAHGVRILGPNCLGLLDTASRLNASFAGELPAAGAIAFMSQSGALCTSILDWSRAEAVGYSKFVSLGNKADIQEVDLLRALAGDEATRVVTMYMEGVADGQEFMRTAREVGSRKPIIAIKSGGTQAGARAVSSHTGSLAGSDNVYDAAFRQCGVIRAASVEALFDYAIGFSQQPLPKGRRLAIVTNAGGPGIMATDAAERQGLWLADFSPQTIEMLRGHLPPAANIYNPVDVLGDALADRYEVALEAVLHDPGVDAVLVLLTPQAMTQIDETAHLLAAQSPRHEKPVFACFMGKAEVQKGIDILKRHGVPSFFFPERAIATIAAMVDYAERRREPAGKPPTFAVDKDAVARVIDDARRDRRRNLVDAPAASIVAAYGIQIPEAGLAHDLTEALHLARDIGYPVVLKIASPDILHKSDIGGIEVGISDDEELRRGYRRLLDAVDRRLPEADIWGVSVQRMIEGGREVILGANRDPQFGPVVLFGLGGIYVEVLRDVSLRVTPVTKREAEEMVREIRSYLLLQGVRGQPRADIKAVVDAILRLSQLVTDFPDIVEMDINPLLVLQPGQGCLAADVRISLGE